MGTRRRLLPALAASLALVSAAACAGRRTASIPSTIVSLPAASSTTTSAAAVTSPVPAPPARPHVMVVVMENREYPSVIGSADSPYVNQLAGRYGLATQSYAASHPSLPNYIDLIAGSTLGITSDCTSCSVDAPVLPDQLAAAGIPWAAYAEGMPGPCFQGPSAAGGYAKKHNPFVYVRHLVASAVQCGRVKPLTALAADLGGPAPPDFAWVSPNLCDDGHDCTTTTADRWLQAFLGPVLGSSWYAAGGVVLLTWDEGDSGAGCCAPPGGPGAAGGHIATLVLSARTPPGARLATPVDHAGLLGTVEDLYGLGHLGAAACTCSGTLAPLLG